MLNLIWTWINLHRLFIQRKYTNRQHVISVNDWIVGILKTANIPYLLQPLDLSRFDGKKTDRLTLVPWKSGRCLTWDVICVNTVAATYLSRSVHCPSGIAKDACRKKETEVCGFRAALSFHSCGGGDHGELDWHS